MTSRPRFADAAAADATAPPRLELLRALPATPAFETPLLFVHGAYSGAWCWQEHFLGFFAAHGFAAHALSLSGHGGSRGRRALDSFSIDDYVRDVAEVVAGLPAPPVLVGHSMGGFVVQRYLERHVAPGAALLCAVPPQGLMPSAVHLLFARPTLMNDLNGLLGGRGASRETLRQALFAQPVAEADLERYFRASQSESKRAVWDMTLPALLDARQVARTPLLVLGAGEDRLIAPALVRATAASYGVPATVFPGLGHGLMLERDWRRPAQALLDWLSAAA